MIPITGNSLITRFTTRQNYAKNSVTAGAVCRVYSYFYVLYITYMHIPCVLKLNYRPNGQRAPQYQEREAQRLRLRATRNYYYTTVGSKRHQKHRRTRGGIEGDTRGRARGGYKRHQRHRRAQRGDRGRHQEFRCLSAPLRGGSRPLKGKGFASFTFLLIHLSLPPCWGSLRILSSPIV
jgi:hypothetical protein